MSSRGCKAGLPIPPLTDADRARFEKFVDRSAGPDSCHWWLGARNGRGYGGFKILGRKYRANRVALALAGVTLAPGEVALHACDERRCVNPAHLRAGTQAENMRDAIERDRIARGDRHGARLHPESIARGDRHGARLHPESIARGDRNGARLHPERRPRGERHGCAKLTAELVTLARDRHAAGESQRALAREFGVSHTVMRNVITRKTWAHVPAAPAAHTAENHANHANHAEGGPDGMPRTSTP